MRSKCTIFQSNWFLFRHASVSRTYTGQSVGRSVGATNRFSLCRRLWAVSFRLMQNISSAQTLRDLTTFDIYVHPTGSGPLLIYFWKGLNVIFLTGLPLQDWISKYRHQMMIGPQCKFAEACFKCFKRLEISGILSMTLHTSQHTSRSWYVQNYVFGFDTNLIILKPIDSVLTLWKSENTKTYSCGL